MLGFRVLCLMRRLIMVMLRGMLMTRLGHILIAGPCWLPCEAMLALSHNSATSWLIVYNRGDCLAGSLSRLMQADLVFGPAGLACCSQLL